MIGIEALCDLARAWRDRAPTDPEAIAAHSELTRLAIRLDLRQTRAPADPGAHHTTRRSDPVSDIDRIGPNAWNTTIHPRMVEAHVQAERATVQRAIEKRKARDAQLAEEREASRLQRASADLNKYREDRRRRWVAATGSEDGFEAAWPGMRAAFADERMNPVEAERERLRHDPRYERL